MGIYIILITKILFLTFLLQYIENVASKKPTSDNLIDVKGSIHKIFLLQYITFISRMKTTKPTLEAKVNQYKRS